MWRDQKGRASFFTAATKDCVFEGRSLECETERAASGAAVSQARRCADIEGRGGRREHGGGLSAWLIPRLEPGS